MIVISDNSVLSCLSEIGELDLLQRLYGRVTITETIRGEAVHSSAPEALRLLFLKMPAWISVVSDESSYLEETVALDYCSGVVQCGKAFLKGLKIKISAPSI